MSTTRQAFTLLELLVVTTVIVVMSALMAVAVDQAMYQAELGVCTGQLRGLSGAVSAYSMDQRTYYPVRSVNTYYPNSVADQPAGDDRPIYRTMFSINKVLNDPLSPSVNLDTEKSPSVIYAGQYLYFGFAFQGYDKVQRLGDRLEWEGLAFNVIAADHSWMDEAASIAFAAHPDKAARMVPERFQDREVPRTSGVVSTPGALSTALGNVYYRTHSRWFEVNWKRGPLDMNYVYTDGSVRRYNDVTWNDERMWVVPAHAAKLSWPAGPSSTNRQYTLLPK